MNTALVLSLFFVTLVYCIPFGVDFRVQDNEKLHHTTEYKTANNVDPNDATRMLVRRSAIFSVYLDDNENLLFFKLIPFDPVRDQSFPKYTITISLVSSFKDKTSFQTVRTPSTGKTKYDIFVPATAPVGMYTWVVVNGTKETSLDNQLVILFNPWSADDDVYLSDQKALQEYLIESDTLLWYGGSSSYGSMGWDYAQFHYNVLEVTLYFIGNVPFQSRGDVVTVSRALSSWINVNDNGGLVWGRWSGSYDDGKSPMFWTGSEALFTQYKSTLTGVKYGQCWVFGGCLTSAGRTLGIPARTITNFDSAHESPFYDRTKKFKMSLDMFFDKNGNYVDTEGGSVWNFHVWCEFWFKRNDLKGSFAGFQAVDATPQERSDGLMQMGPASIAAIKQLKTDLKYDTDFVASEVGSAITKWIGYNTGKQAHPKRANYWLLESDPNGAGKKMSTKSIGSNSRQDITSTYKNPRMLSRRIFSHIFRSENVTFEIISPDQVFAGSDIVLTIEADCSVCSPSNSYVLGISGLIQMMTYTGELVKVLRQGSVNVTLNSGRTTQSLTVSADEYLPYFTDNHVVEYHAFVKQYSNGFYTNNYALKNGRFGITLPPMVITIASQTNQVVSLNIYWKNTLQKTISSGFLRISGSAIYPQDMKVPDLNSGDEINVKLLNVYLASNINNTTDVTIFVKFISPDIPALNAFVSVK